MLAKIDHYLHSFCFIPFIKVPCSAVVPTVSPVFGSIQFAYANNSVFPGPPDYVSPSIFIGGVVLTEPIEGLSFGKHPSKSTERDSFRPFSVLNSGLDQSIVCTLTLDSDSKSFISCLTGI